ncbi:MAG: DUF1638 domain-containing protein [Alphaproteobacteria bacterium]
MAQKPAPDQSPPDLSVDAAPLLEAEGTAPALVIACGALAREIVEFRAANGFRHLDIACLPAKLHNRPQLIAEAVREKIRAHKAKYRSIFVAYGDCGTGGDLDKVLAEEGVERIGGPHCYAFYTGQAAFEAITDEDPTSFFLTDYMVRHFDRLIIEGLGLDRFPDLLNDYFGNYTNVIYIAQAAAERLGLGYVYRFVGFGELGDFLNMAAAEKEKSLAP